MQIAVGGCLAQKDRAEIVRRAPWVDVVFGTHNIGSLPVLLERARSQQRGAGRDRSRRWRSSRRRCRRDARVAYAAWVAISVGCNNTCTFCIVPALRGRERDRRPGDMLAEVEALVADGVLEVTLLGQNVNAYGVEFGDRLRLRQAAARRAARSRDSSGCGSPARIHATSPTTSSRRWPRRPTVMPSAAHAAAVRLGRRARGGCAGRTAGTATCGIVEKVRAAMPDAAITTDIIVGFPGETEADFAQTLEIVREARFASAFTFQYSKRPGTPAATMDDQVPKGVVQDRYERLVDVVEEVAWAENQAFVGREVEILVAEGEGRKDDRTRPAVRARRGTTGWSTSRCRRMARCRGLETC